MPLKNLSCNFPCVRMGARGSDSDEILPKDADQEPVMLNVYDMYKAVNEYTRNLGFGIFHSGVEVHGIEYGFGGHPYRNSGIFKTEPRNVEELQEYFGRSSQFRFRQSIFMGYTNFSQKETKRITRKLGKKFRGNKYHVLNNNCNHFTSCLTKLLCQKDIPSWVNRLANFGSFVPFLERWMPQEWVNPEVLIEKGLNFDHEQLNDNKRGETYLNYYYNRANRRERNRSGCHFCHHNN